MKLRYCIIWLIFWFTVPTTIYQVYFMPHYALALPAAETIKNVVVGIIFVIIGLLPITFKLAFGSDGEVVDGNQENEL
jgi:hypothetical protein